MSEWIKCSDRLPVDNDLVLCSGISQGHGCRDVFIGSRDIRGSWFEYNNGDYIDGGYGDNYPATVTHWQPIPAPASPDE